MKIDEDKELVRGPDGLCVKCQPGTRSLEPEWLYLRVAGTRTFILSNFRFDIRSY